MAGDSKVISLAQYRSSRGSRSTTQAASFSRTLLAGTISDLFDGKQLMTRRAAALSAGDRTTMRLLIVKRNCPVLLMTQAVMVSSAEKKQIISRGYLLGITLLVDRLPVTTALYRPEAYLVQDNKKTIMDTINHSHDPLLLAPALKAARALGLTVAASRLGEIVSAYRDTSQIIREATLLWLTIFAQTQAGNPAQLSRLASYFSSDFADQALILAARYFGVQGKYAVIRFIARQPEPVKQRLAEQIFQSLPARKNGLAVMGTQHHEWEKAFSLDCQNVNLSPLTSFYYFATTSVLDTA